MVINNCKFAHVYTAGAQDYSRQAVYDANVNKTSVILGHMRCCYAVGSDVTKITCNAPFPEFSV